MSDSGGFPGRLLGSPAFLLGATLTALFVGMALASLAWTPFDPTLQDIPGRFAPPSRAHWLGTDQYGRDVFSIILAGARASAAVALLAVGIGALIGVPLGLAAAAGGGLPDEALMRSSDVIFAFPALVSAIMLTAIFGPSVVNAVVAIGVFNIPVFARVARAGAIVLWRREFVLAARTSGKGALRITAEHILPNIASILIVQATIQFSLGILAEAGLSYVGLGVQPPTPSWGRMLAEAQTLAARAPLLAIVPGLAIMLAVLGANLLGDGLRDALDPRLRRTS